MQISYDGAISYNKFIFLKTLLRDRPVQVSKAPLNCTLASFSIRAVGDKHLLHSINLYRGEIIDIHTILNHYQLDKYIEYILQ